MICSRIFFAALALAAATALEARPLTPAEGRFMPFSGELPACNQENVLSRIQSRFSQRESTYWKSGLQIQEFLDVRESGFRTAGMDLIPRRFCQSKISMNDGRVRNLKYSIGENQGIIGWSWGVEWCIVGLDHHNAFGPNCSTAGP